MPNAQGLLPNPFYGNTALRETLQNSMASMKGMLGLRPGARVRLDCPGRPLHGMQGRLVRELARGGGGRGRREALRGRAASWRQRRQGRGP